MIDTYSTTGPGSIAWFINAFKTHPHKRGFSWIRLDTDHKPQFDVLKEQVLGLVSAGYLAEMGKDGGPRSRWFAITSFGHRYLESHKDEIDGGKPVENSEVPVDRAADQDSPSSLQGKKFGSTITDAPKVKPVIKSVLTSEDAEIPDDTVPLPEASSSPAPTTGPMAWCDNCDEYVDSWREQCKDHVFIVNPKKYYTSIALENHICKTEAPTPPETMKSGDLVERIYSEVGEILLQKYKNNDLMSNTTITVKDVINHLENKNATN